MNDQILTNLNKPAELEKLYRSNRATFKQEFLKIYPSISGNSIAECWYERLNYETGDISWGTKKGWLFVLFASLIAGFLAKLPAFFTIDEDFFYPRNISFMVFPFLTAYFARTNNLGLKKTAYLMSALLICILYINFLPDSTNSDTLFLACIHLPLLLWAFLGFSFAGQNFNSFSKHLDFLRFNGDLLVMTALLGLAGIITSGISIGLFEIIGVSIEEFFFEYLVIFALPAIPILATYLTHTNPQLVNKVSPVIAKIFSPLVLVILCFYLGTILFLGKDPYNDREFLLIFNLLLIGVMALIFFSVAEISNKKKSIFAIWVLFLLALITIIVNGIALSAIVFRISQWGITPNRLAVMGGNILILLHLILVSIRLFHSIVKNRNIAEVGRSIAAFFPIYILWTFLVVFLFPVIFNFK